MQGTDGAIFSEPFKVDNKIVAKRHLLYIHYSEKAMEERRERQKITAAFSMHSIEGGHVFANDNVAVPYCRRKYFDGSNASTGIGPIPLVTDTEAWTMTFKEKKDLYGKANRVAPGGRTAGIDPAAAKALTRKDTDLEAVFHWSLPWEFYYDAMKGLNPRTITMLCVGDGSAAIAAMLMERWVGGWMGVWVSG